MNRQLTIGVGALAVALLALAALVTVRRDLDEENVRCEPAPSLDAIPKRASDGAAEGLPAAETARTSERAKRKNADSRTARRPSNVAEVIRSPRSRTVEATEAKERMSTAARPVADADGVARGASFTGRKRTAAKQDGDGVVIGAGGGARRISAGVAAPDLDAGAEGAAEPAADIAAEPPAEWVEPEVAQAIFEGTATRNEEARQRREEEQQAEPEHILPAVSVMRRDALSEEGVMTVVFSIVPEPDLAADVAGLVLSQRIPPGWSVEDVQPPFTSYDPRTRVAKWLIVSKPIQAGQISYRGVPVDGDAALEDWSLSQSWYTYREPGRIEGLSFSTVRR